MGRAARFPSMGVFLLFFGRRFLNGALFALVPALGGFIRLGSGIGRVVGEQDGCAIAFKRRWAKALDLGQVIGTLERPMSIAPSDDLLCL